jgi:predicted nucleic acid-binding protein
MDRDADSVKARRRFLPGHADLLRAARFERRHKMSWWDALVLTSAVELGCGVLWSEDLADGQRYGSVTVRNPFA